jgi:hypothetical protein
MWLMKVPVSVSSPPQVHSLHNTPEGLRPGYIQDTDSRATIFR